MPSGSSSRFRQITVAAPTSLKSPRPPALPQASFSQKNTELKLIAPVSALRRRTANLTTIMKESFINKGVP